MTIPVAGATEGTGSERPTPASVLGQIRTRSVLVGCPRSGSTLAHTAIMGHPNASVLSDEMPVYPFFYKGLSTFTCGSEFDEEKAGGHRALFDAMASICADEHSTMLGVKCNARSVEQAHAVVRCMREHLPHHKVILTIRNDLVAQYGSLLSARMTGSWHSWNPGAARLRRKRPPLIRAMFVRYCLNSLEVNRVLRQLHSSHEVHECIYEDVVADRNEQLLRLFDFLELGRMQITWLKGEKVKPPPQKYIRNYEKLSKVLTRLRDQHERDAVPAATRFMAGCIDRTSSLVYRAIGVLRRS